MKTISIYLQIAALAACFAAQFHPDVVTGMPGTRKALQTLETFATQPATAPAVEILASAGR